MASLYLNATLNWMPAKHSVQPGPRGSVFIFFSTVGTAYKVAICPRGNLLYMQIYLINDQNLLQRSLLGLKLIYFIGDFTL